MLARAARSAVCSLRTQVATPKAAGSLHQLRGMATAAETAQGALNLSRTSTWGLAAAAAAGCGAYYYVFQAPASAASKEQLTKLPANEHPHDIGTFSLTEASGKKFTEANVKKEFAVLLFGALDHPDFHTWMEKFAKAVYESDEKCNQEHLKPIVLCLDAEKDTPERCKETKDGLRSHKLWKETFHRRVAIVTGEDVAKVHEAAHHFTKKFFGKHPKNTGTPCSTDLGDIYMISPDGKFLEAYGLNDASPEDISDDWARVQRAWNVHHPSWHGCRNVAKRYA